MEDWIVGDAYSVILEVLWEQGLNKSYIWALNLTDILSEQGQQETVQNKIAGISYRGLQSNLILPEEIFPLCECGEISKQIFLYLWPLLEEFNKLNYKISLKIAYSDWFVELDKRL